MTVPAFAQPLDSCLPSADEREVANHLRTVIAAHVSNGGALRVLDEARTPTEITLTPAISELLIDLLRHIGSGDAVTLVPIRQMLTTQQAADILNVSRPYLVGLLEHGAMEYELVGRHRRIKAETLFAYKQRRDQDRRAALERLAEADADAI